MPLYIPQTNPTAAGLHSILRAMAKLAPPDAKPSIMVFYSSPGDDGKMWCPHCVNIEPVITKIFGDEAPEAPQATVIYVGDRATFVCLVFICVAVLLYLVAHYWKSKGGIEGYI